MSTNGPSRLPPARRSAHHREDERRAASRSRGAPLVLAVMSALIVALGSGWLGPFVLMPVAACAASTMFLMHGTREEAPAHVAVWVVAILATFGVEWLHLVPAAYTFTGGDIVLHSRLLRLPEGATIACLAYTSVSFVAFLGYFVAQLRGKQREAERRLLWPGHGCSTRQRAFRRRARRATDRRRQAADERDAREAGGRGRCAS